MSRSRILAVTFSLLVLGVCTSVAAEEPDTTTGRGMLDQRLGEEEESEERRPASGGLRLELEPFVGYLGTDRDESIDDGPWGGLRIGVRPIDPLAIELSGAVQPGSYRGTDGYGREGDYGMLLSLVRLEATWDIDRSLLHGDLIPFVAVGGGVKIAYPTELDIGARDDVDLALGWGLGLRYLLNDWIGLRLDLRHTLTTPVAPYTYPGKVTDDLGSDLFNELEADLGLFFVIGGSRDRDHDGVLDGVDACVDRPEDRDRFEDGDGCPDPDNDHDGTLDVEDGCPTSLGPPENAGCPDTDLDGDGVNDRQDQCVREKGPAENFGCPDTDWDVDGVPDRLDKCPDEKGDPRAAGCPLPDTDGDGLAGPDDRCPDQPEDKDGFEDTDGCPDNDNDGDGIPDGKDRCRNEAETINGFKDDDGCPDKGPPSKVKVTETKVEILDLVYFDLNKATIQARSFDVLRQVASVLKATPRITGLRVEGHTDNRGNEQANLALSQKRAEAVKAFLIKQGVRPEVLSAQGFGQTRPIADNSKPAGQALNRRVEFVITSLDGKPVGEQPAPAPGAAPAPADGTAPAPADGTAPAPADKPTQGK